MVQHCTSLELRARFAALALSLWACVSGACAPAQVPTLTRTLDGRPTPGRFVPAHAYEWYTRGELALLHGDPVAAAEAFQLALTAPEVDPFVLSRFAVAASRAGDDSAAADALAEAERLSPCLPELWLVRGEIAASRSAHTEALAHYRRAVDCQPDHAAARRALVTALTRAGAESRALAVATERDEARGTCRQGLCPAAASREARQLQLEAAIAQQDTEALRALTPTDLAQAVLPRPLVARALTALGEHERAAMAWSWAAPVSEADLPRAALAFARVGYFQQASAAAEAALGTPLQADDRLAMDGVLAQAAFAEGGVQAGVDALVPGSLPQLSRWLTEAGLPGLAGELTSREPTAPAERSTQ